jgi:hypothetical protein
MNSIVCIGLFSLPGTCLAYVGPGSGITLLWSLLAVLGGILFMVLGLALWPVRLLLRLTRRNKPNKVSGSNQNLPPQDSKVVADDK